MLVWIGNLEHTQLLIWKNVIGNILAIILNCCDCICFQISIVVLLFLLLFLQVMIQKNKFWNYRMKNVSQPCDDDSKKINVGITHGSSSSQIFQDCSIYKKIDIVAGTKVTMQMRLIFAWIFIYSLGKTLFNLVCLWKHLFLVIIIAFAWWWLDFDNYINIWIGFRYWSQGQLFFFFLYLIWL